MSEHDAILFANTAFYAAFAARDAEAMEKAWAKNRPVSCIHPGRPVIAGWDAVMRSWRAILDNPESPRITCHDAKVHLHGDMALVTCVEQVAVRDGVMFLMATNAFVRTGALWFLVHHQAGSVHIEPGTIQAEPKQPIN